jgi:menaquinone-dependent protoporphyrinogen IX oxidase
MAITSPPGPVGIPPPEVVVPESASRMGPSATPHMALVAYGTRFGNTERIAESLAAGMRKTRGVAVDCLYIGEVSIESFGRYDFLAIGGPTEKMSASKPMKEFLEQIPATALHGKRGFAFDTRFDVLLSGSAARFIEKFLESLGVEIVRPHASAFVRGLNREEKARYGNVGTPEWVRNLDRSISGGATAKPARLDLLYPASEAKFEEIGTELGSIFATPPPLLAGASSAGRPLAT